MADPQTRARLQELHESSFGWALSCCRGNRQDAEEVLQAAYLKVLSGKARFGGRSSFRTWFFSVVRLTAADQRRQRARRWASLQTMTQRLQDKPPDRGNEYDVDRQRLRDRFRKLLQALPNRQREVIQLVFYHDHTLSEAAQIMGVSIGSARTHYHRAKSRLREWVQEQEGVD